MKLPSGFYRIEGDDPDGPNVVICGGTHGDEPVGVNVVRRLLSDFGLKGKPTGVYKHELITSGALYLGFGNPVAIACETRAAAGKGPDLNRSFSRVELDQSPSENERHDLVRARELMPLFEQTDYLLDIHSTSSDSVPFVKGTPFLRQQF